MLHNDDITPPTIDKRTTSSHIRQDLESTDVDNPLALHDYR